MKLKELICKQNRDKVEGIDELAKSINELGLIHPLTVNKKNEVVDGRRRFLALQKLKVEDVSVVIVDFDGDDDVASFTANDLRVNLTLWEQVAALEAMAKNHKFEELGELTGRGPKWIRRRLQLAQALPGWRQLAAKTPTVTVEHLELISSLHVDAQKMLLERFQYHVEPFKEFKATVDQLCFVEIGKLPWAEKGCGKCPSCTIPDLFGEKRCSNIAYLDQARERYIEAKIKAAPADMIFVVDMYGCSASELPKTPRPVLNQSEYDPDPKGVPAMLVSGSRDLGKIIKIKVRKQAVAKSKSVKGAETPMADKQKQLAKRRLRHAIAALIEFMQKGKYKTPPIEAQYKLMAVLGVRSTQGGKLVEVLDKTPVEGILDNVWKQGVLPEVVRELNYGQEGPMAPKTAEAASLANLVGFDLKKANADAVNMLPNPKSWTGNINNKKVATVKK